jgi:apolipoprotein N-acyltransferase
MSLLGHTQLPLLPLLQIADLTGAYGVSFLVMTGAAALERLWPQEGRPSSPWKPFAFAPAVLAVCWGYGEFRLREASPNSADNAFKVALIQGVYDTQFDGDPERPVLAFRDYVRLSQQAVAQTPDLSLLIWPESMFTADGPMITYDEPLELIPEWDGSLPEFRQRIDAIARAVRAKAQWVAQLVDVPLIVGTAWDHLQDGETHRYNSAVHIDREGNLEARYDKMHPVMFGEYIPGGEWFPWLYRLTPMPTGLTPGTAPVPFEMEGIRICPSICFENTVPHLIRRQVRQLKAQSKAPDVLVTITNDGWFWGSSLLDVHLACGIFRAVETRLPLLIAANTGFSAWIDADGRVRAQGPRREEGIVVAEVVPTDRSSPYSAAGDWFAGLCLLVSSWSWVRGWRREAADGRPGAGGA